MRQHHKYALLLVLILPFIAGTYGVVHDQITYSISEAYFTKFKFFQFGLATEIYPEPIFGDRIAAALVGWMATWWTGIPIGLMLGLFYWIRKVEELRIGKNAILRMFIITFIGGVLGGVFFLIVKYLTRDWPMIIAGRYQAIEPYEALDFMLVGSIHNGSYLGGIAALIYGFFYLRKRTKIKQKSLND